MRISSSPMVGWQPYPWKSVQKLTLTDVGLMRCAATTLIGAVDTTKLARALSEILRGPVTVSAAPMRRVREFRPAEVRGAWCLLELMPSETPVLVEIEADLAACVAGAVFRQSVKLIDRLASVPDQVQSCVAGALVTVFRASSVAQPPRLVAIGRDSLTMFSEMPADGLVRVPLTVELCAMPFRVTLWLTPGQAVGCLQPLSGRHLLGRLGHLPLGLALFGACAGLPRARFESLRVGDCLMPGEFWSVRRMGEHDLVGDVLLSAPWGFKGMRAKLIGPAQVMLRGDFVDMLDHTAQSDDSSAQPPLRPEPLANMLGEAPVVVRVELGTATLTGRQWAELREGDVVVTNSRVADQVTLRVAGHAVAFGELVDVDGELGVRLVRLETREGGENQ